MNRTVNLTKTKKVSLTGTSCASKPNRKQFHKVSESSSLSSNRNSSEQSEEETGNNVYRQQVAVNNCSYEEQNHVMKKLQLQIKELRHKLRVLEESVDNKDYCLGAVAREKDRAVGELRRLERINKQLKQQLSEERNHYLGEKEKFCTEMTRYKRRLQDIKKVSEPSQKTAITNQKWSPNASNKQPQSSGIKSFWQRGWEKGDSRNLNPKEEKVSKKTELPNIEKVKLESCEQIGDFNFSKSQFRKSGSLESLRLYNGEDSSLQMAALRTENARLRSVISERDERNYELCLRFLRMKHCKNDLKTRFQDLENEYLQVISNLMEKIDEARREFNFIIHQKFKKPLPSTNAAYLQLVQRNSRIAFENASLRLEIQSLRKELNKHINVNTEYGRKLDSTIAGDGQEFQNALTESKSETKLKTLKKNVNFKEMRTIFESDRKTSDTDSNYMSRTSTTATTSEIAGEPKSSESIEIVASNLVNQKKEQTNIRLDGVQDEVFRRILQADENDSTSTTNMILDSDPMPTPHFDDKKTAARRRLHTGDAVREYSPGNDQRPENENSYSAGKGNENSSGRIKKQERTKKKTPKKAEDENRYDKNTKQFLQMLPYSPSEMAVFQNRTREMLDEERIAYFGEKPSTRKSPDNTAHDRNLKDYNSSSKKRTQCFLNEENSCYFESLNPNELITFSPNKSRSYYVKDYRAKRNEHYLRKSLDIRDRPKSPRQFKEEGNRYPDGCGLQEKIMESSDLELSTDAACEMQTIKSPKTEKVNPKGKLQLKEAVVRVNQTKIKQSSELNKRTEHRDRKIDEMIEEEKTTTVKHLSSDDSIKITPVITRNRNAISLRDELMEATKTQMKTELPQDFSDLKPAGGNKRFSQRLVTTNPENLKNLLGKSKFGCYQVAPVIVGHATADLKSMLRLPERSNEIVCQLIPSDDDKGTSNPYLVADAALETEISKNPEQNLESTKISDILLPVSNLATSRSSFEIPDQSEINDGSVVMRTFSAPGLLESDWLESSKILSSK